MLIKFYAPTQSHRFNHTPQCEECQLCTQAKFRNLQYRTTSLEPFENLSVKTVEELFKEQLDASKQEADLYQKHNFLNKQTYEKTIEQYRLFYFQDGHAYLKTEIIDFLTKQYKQENTLIQKPQLQTFQSTNTTPTTQTTSTTSTINEDEQTHQISKDKISKYVQDNNTVFVSREAIRNITGYSYNAIRQWDETKTPVYVKWQHDLLDDQRDIIVVDGSRQMGKSFTIAEKLIEESHIPNNDSLVGAFLEKTTNVIRNYVLRLIKKFPLEHFTHFKKEGYIINNLTGSKIFFRTLSDGGDNVLGLTLKRAIIDEAQFVDIDTFENAILPTLSTTGGQLIMIGTPSKIKTGYMYQTIVNIRKGILTQEESSYYRISADQNPFLHPKERKRIEARRDDPAIQRQYYNAWGDIGDNLFKINKCKNFPNIDLTNNFTVMGIDPARIHDRSANSILHVSNGKIYIIQSGFVPDSHKKDWNLQAKFYTSLINRFNNNQKRGEHSSKWYNVMDVSGVGDGAAQIFRNEGIKISANIRYTSGAGETNDGINYRVAKSVLINTFLDLCQEGIIEIYESTNKDLLEELDHIEEKEGRAGQTEMKSDFFDDITNATMIAAYFIVKRRLLRASQYSIESPFKPSGIQHMDAIEYRSSNSFLNSSSMW